MLEMVSIITVNFNQTELSCALLESIRQQEYNDIEIIVVDNASTEDPTALFQQRYPEARVIRNEKNLGFAGANNRACIEAKGDFLFFVNNDAEITPGCIARLRHFLETTPAAGIVSPLICYYPANKGHQLLSVNAPGPWHQWVNSPPSIIQYAGMPQVNRFTGRSNMDGNGAENQGQYTQAFATGYAHGAGMMIPRRVWETVGPMQEAYFLYYEEIDWCERIRRAGYGVWVEPRALLWHKENSTMQGLGAAKTYYLTRNRIWFMKRYYGGWTFRFFCLFVVFITVPRNIIAYIFTGQWADLRAFLKGVKHGLSYDSFDLSDLDDSNDPPTPSPTEALLGA